MDSFGKFVELYEPKAHLGPNEAWYVRAVAGKGEVVWTDVRNHSSGHAQGFAATTAVYNTYHALLGVSGAAFTMHYLNRRGVIHVVKSPPNIDLAIGGIRPLGL